MKNCRQQNELISKRWCCLAGSPESFGGGSNDERPTTPQAKDVDRSKLAELSQRVENQTSTSVETSESQTESVEESADGMSDVVEQRLQKNERQLTKLNVENQTEGVLLTRLVAVPPDRAAVDKLRQQNPILGDSWDQQVVSPTRNKLNDLLPGSLT